MLSFNMEEERGSRKEEMHVVRVGAGRGDVLEGVGARADVMGIVGIGDVRQHLEGYREYDVGVEYLE